VVEGEKTTLAILGQSKVIAVYKTIVILPKILLTSRQVSLTTLSIS